MEYDILRAHSLINNKLFKAFPNASNTTHCWNYKKFTAAERLCQNFLDDFRLIFISTNANFTFKHNLKWFNAHGEESRIDFTARHYKQWIEATTSDLMRILKLQTFYCISLIFNHAVMFSEKSSANGSPQSHLKQLMKHWPWIHPPTPGVWSYRRTCLRSPPTSYSGGRQSLGTGDGSLPHGPAGGAHTHTRSLLAFQGKPPRSSGRQSEHFLSCRLSSFKQEWHK